MKPEKLELEYRRLDEMSLYEKKHADFKYICGIDEAGRGPLAGPVVAAAVILKKNDKFIYLNDSKKVSPKRRDVLFDEIRERAVAYGIGVISESVIDEVNILNATFAAMRQAVAQMKVTPDICLVDAVKIPGIDIRQDPIIKGDAVSVSIAAASILAKVTRDRLMEDYAKEYPEYGFERHKGYGTKAHMEAIETYGPCPIHRKSFLKL